MKTAKGGATASLLVLCLLSCARPSTLSPAYRTALADTVLVAMNEYFAALRALDGDSAVSYLAPEFWAYNGAEFIGYDSTAAGTRRFVSALQRFEGDWTQREVRVLSADAAIVTGSLWQTYTDTTGHVTSFRGTVVWAWVRRGDRWCAAFVHAAPDPNN
jgi:ketosteroid isomerase-like protein